MADSNFIDYVKVLCRSGKGGAGSRHFHRAKYVPKGGPDGGDGGRGGHIILRGNAHMWTLLPLRYRRHIFAGNGESGSGGRSFGKDGEDVVVDVPCGTVVFDAESAATAAQQLDFLAVGSHFAEKLAGLGIKDHCTAGYVNNDILAILPE